MRVGEPARVYCKRVPKGFLEKAHKTNTLRTIGLKPMCEHACEHISACTHVYACFRTQ